MVGRGGIQRSYRLGEGAWDRLEPELLGTVYIDHMAAEDRPERVRASYGENYARLRELKAVYDPMNLFRVNANVSPV